MWITVSLHLSNYHKHCVVNKPLLCMNKTEQVRICVSYIVGVNEVLKWSIWNIFHDDTIVINLRY